ncbi:MAG: 16S rRNA (uracil(1498)-N(3))-methyltransferase [Bacteroidales bacterium]
MNFFYATHIHGSTIVLPPDESHHCLHVLRMKQGEEAIVVDGRGNLYHCILSINKGKECYMEINSYEQIQPRPYHLHLAMACLKTHERMEWLVEKATEIGIDEITFLNTRYTERKHFNVERLQKIAISAMKQSQKAFLPKIHPQLIPFAHFLESHPPVSQKYIAHCYANLTERLSLARVCNAGETVLCLIGPEGDFSEEEVKLALDHNFIPVSLGNARLRSETAALAVCFTLAIKNEAEL